MSLSSLSLVLASVAMSAVAQILLKVGMSDPRLQSAVGHLGLGESYARVLMSPVVIAGLLTYGVGALIWLRALATLDVSQAYPFVALGFVLTMIFAVIVLGEPVHATRLAGAALIVAGVVLIGLR